MRFSVSELVVDCREPASLVRFWAALLGGTPVDREADWSYVDPPGFRRLAFQRVPEAKTVKNRLHLDLDVEDLTAATERAEELGAIRVGARVTDEQGTFQVLLDPEGNEFCLLG
ncbi:VOC family protein [Streptomyces sp. URMC 123]|uniref:VOC family protein n=1 Tax=Streptomyces sp. URMC 123 TaxID=3423403 RepID=UPI003F1CFB1F